MAEATSVAELPVALTSPLAACAPVGLGHCRPLHLRGLMPSLLVPALDRPLAREPQRFLPTSAGHPLSGAPIEPTVSTVGSRRSPAPLCLRHHPRTTSPALSCHVYGLFLRVRPQVHASRAGCLLLTYCSAPEPRTGSLNLALLTFGTG